MEALSAAPHSPPSRAVRRIRWQLYALMTLFGIAVTIVGPSLPELAHRVGVTLGTAGFAFSATGLGIAAASLMGGRAVQRLGGRRVLMLSLAALGLGAALVAISPSLPVLLIGFVIMGCGQGVLQTALNILAGDLEPDQRTAALNRLHLFAGVGCVLGPNLAGLALARGQAAGAFWAVAVISWLLLLWPHTPFPAPAAAPCPGGTAQPDRRPASPYRSLTTCLLAGVCMCYIGAELGFGGWLFTALLEHTGMSTGAAAFMTSALYLAISCGRLLGAWLLRHVPTLRFLIGSVALAGASVATFMLGGEWAVLAVTAVLVAGIALGPIFPTALGYATTRSGAAVNETSAMLTAVGSIGGLIFPALQGRVLERWGAIWSMAQPLTLLALMLALLVLIAGRTGQPEPARPTR